MNGFPDRKRTMTGTTGESIHDEDDVYQRAPALESGCDRMSAGAFTATQRHPAAAALPIIGCLDVGNDVARGSYQFKAVSWIAARFPGRVRLPIPGPPLF